MANESPSLADEVSAAAELDVLADQYEQQLVAQRAEQLVVMGNQLTVDRTDFGSSASYLIFDWRALKRRVSEAQDGDGIGTDAALNAMAAAFDEEQWLLGRPDVQQLRSVFLMRRWSFDPDTIEVKIAKYSRSTGTNLSDIESMMVRELAEVLGRWHENPFPSDTNSATVDRPNSLSAASDSPAITEAAQASSRQEGLMVRGEEEAVTGVSTATGDATFSPTGGYSQVRAHRVPLFPKGEECVGRDMVELIRMLESQGVTRPYEHIARDYYANCDNPGVQALKALSSVRKMRSDGRTTLPRREDLVRAHRQWKIHCRS